ncbi:MAG TPA: hypothetical protein VF621_13400, partial [Pyrinomonadaceae bacterium]
MATMVIKRFGILSATKITAVVWAGLGLAIGIPLGLLMIIVGAAVMSSSGRDGTVIGMGLFYMIGLPIIYGVMGLIFGAIGALVYNLTAPTIGGLEFELDNKDAGYAEP